MRNMKRLILLILFSGVVSLAFAQSFEEYRRQRQAAFDAYRNRTQSEFERYRAKRNAEFAAYLQQTWQSYPTQPGRPMMKQPKPRQPEVDTSQPSPVVLPIGEVRKWQLPVSQPLPLSLKPQGDAVRNGLRFDFYGQTLQTGFPRSAAFTLKGIDEKSVGKMWKELVASELYEQLLADCVRWHAELELGDWGYVLLIEKLTAALFGSVSSNEAVLLQGYLLTQSGLDVRIVHEDQGRLLLAVSVDCKLSWNYYVTVGKRAYYFRNYGQSVGSIRTYANPYATQSRPCGMVQEAMPKLPYTEAVSVAHISRRYPELAARPAVNKNLMMYLDDFPITDFPIYVYTGMSETLKHQLLPMLRRRLEGLSQVEAANRLIDFVQTGFEYAKDDDQFKREKPFFIDELFFYPRSDCEDRAIFYAYLMRELLGLDAALLYYPNHLAVAVAFDQQPEGTAIIVNGRRYLVCDPTNNRIIGQIHKDYRSVKPEVYICE